MSAVHKYELSLHIKSLRNIGIRQACFLQIRTVVFHKNQRKQNVTATPYQIIQLSTQNLSLKEEASSALEDYTFLSPKIVVKNMDKNINIDCMCLFKGQIEIPKGNKSSHELHIYSELIWFIGKQMEVIGQWKGYSKLTTFHSYIDMYFSTHLLTCSVEASVQCILSETTLIEQEKLVTQSKQKIFYNHITKGYTQLYDACIDPLIHSILVLKDWLKQFGKLTNLPENVRRSSENSSWKYNNLAKNLGKNSDEAFHKSLNQLSNTEYIFNLNSDAHNISSNQYMLWKQFLSLFKKFPQSNYFRALKEKYHRSLQKDHWSNKIILIGETKQGIKKVFEPEIEQLQFRSVEQHTSQLKLTCKDFELLSKPIARKKQRIIVLVHGYQASSFDMEIIGMYFKFRNPQIHILISECNEGQTEGVIQECGHRLAIEIKNYINSRQFKDFSISFIGHSLGGIIIRASLRYLQLYKSNFECFVSLCSPHMGYLYHTSKLVTTSLWVMNQFKKDPSMIELSMSDNKTLSKCYIYELAERDNLKWFNTIILAGSKQDEYVPYSSALLQNMEFFYQSQSAKTYQTIYNNIIKPIESKVIRLEILFNDRIKDLSGFIGRTAHIKVLSFLPTIDLYCHLISKRL